MINAELENLKENAEPFIDIWKDAHKDKNIKLEQGKEGRYCIVTESLDTTFREAFLSLKYGNLDFVFIHGISATKNEDDSINHAYGLLCTSIEEKEDLEEQDCFFIGEIYQGIDENEKCVVLNTKQLINYLGTNARYRIGKLTIVETQDSHFIRIDSFMKALEKI